MPIHYYVYYRVEASEVPALAASLDAMQLILAEETGVNGRVLKRTDDPLTWMEVYENVADPSGFEFTLQELVETFTLERYLAPNAHRVVERFEG